MPEINIAYPNLPADAQALYDQLMQQYQQMVGYMNEYLDPAKFTEYTNTLADEFTGRVGTQLER